MVSVATTTMYTRGRHQTDQATQHSRAVSDWPSGQHPQNGRFSGLPQLINKQHTNNTNQRQELELELGQPQ